MIGPGVRVAWPFRVWLAAEVFFGLAAVLSVGRAPAETATNFAWPIQPVVMAAVLGAFYFAVMITFVLAVSARRWEMIRVLVIPAAIFTSIELLATLLHWDKFSEGTAPFNLWLASYALPPAIYLAAYVWHQRRAGKPAYDNPLPPWIRIVFIVVGALLTIDAAVAFVHPTYFSESFPWALTPLTTRVLCGFLIALGTILLSAARENDTARVRVVSPIFALLLPAALVQMARYWDQVDTGNFRFWTTVAILAVVWVGGVYIAWGNWRETLG